MFVSNKSLTFISSLVLCQVVLGQACSNESDFEFTLDNLDKDVNCAWITQNKKRKEVRMERYCSTPDISAACPVACDKCPTEGICLSDNCEGTGSDKTCTFNMKIDLHAGELGYYTVDECGDEPNPTLGVVKGTTYIFKQQDESNYYHPLGLAYYPDGAHADVDELEPGIAPPGSASSCADNNSCPAPMYIKNGNYLGEYSNNELIAPIADSENFGLDDYEPEFFFDPITWRSEDGSEVEYEVALKFDIDDFEDDIFYFCHIHQYMTGRIKFVDEIGQVITKANLPTIEYEYDEPSDHDVGCGTFGTGDFILPNAECPDKFVCGADDSDTPVHKFAQCINSMNCAMTAGMTTGLTSGSVLALFNHQMIPHHQNAVNMCKAMLVSGEAECADITDEDLLGGDLVKCGMRVLCYEIINQQNSQIQAMRGFLETLAEEDSGVKAEDDCVVTV